MTLTAGGRRLVPIASQMIALAAEAEDAIRQAQGAPDRLRVVATSTVAESVAPGLLAAFGARAGAVDVTLGVASSEAARAGHPRCAAGRGRAPALAGQVWLVAADATDPASPVGGLLRQLGVAEADVRGFGRPAAGGGGGA